MIKLATSSPGECRVNPERERPVDWLPITGAARPPDTDWMPRKVTRRTWPHARKEEKSSRGETKEGVCSTEEDVLYLAR